MTEFGFRKCHHLRTGKDFKRTFERRVSVADDVMIVYGCENEVEDVRLGLSVSRKVGNAVVRNRWKRAIREAFRLNRVKLGSGTDFVVIPRRGVKPEFDRIAPSLLALTRRVKTKLERKPR